MNYKVPQCIDLENEILDEFEKSPFLAGVMLKVIPYAECFFRESNRERFQNLQIDMTAERKWQMFIETAKHRKRIEELMAEVHDIYERFGVPTP